MPGRRDALLDAAIDVLGRHGARRLTHRAVDAAAGCPPGSTSNHFRTRAALLTGVVDRVVTRERATWAPLAAAAPPASALEVARLLADVVRLAVGPNRTLTLARFVLLLEGATDERLRAVLAEGGRRAGEGVAAMLDAAGSAAPGAHARLVANFLTGLMLHQVTVPQRDFDPYPDIAALLAALARHAEEAP